METFVVVLQNETLKVMADEFILEDGETFQFYRDKDELVAWFRVDDVQRVYAEQ